MNIISEKHISVVIPNYNNSTTIGKCLEAVFSSRYSNYEVIVVDDCSDDNSVEIIESFPCRLIKLEQHSGASGSRNRGGFSSKGDLIFFTDADCILNEDTLSIINRSVDESDVHTVTGGTYTMMPYDRGFFNAFQSVFVNYFETKNIDAPDYIAAHAMVINSDTFKKSKGFPDVFLPIIEDVEFSHRLRRMGCRLVMNPEIELRHIFNFTLFRSIMNSVRKSKYWTLYSLKNHDAMSDSGCASSELKTNVVSGFLSIILLTVWMVSGNILLAVLLLFILSGNVYFNRRLFGAFFGAGGPAFGLMATLYYIFIYSFSVGTGAAAGLLKYFMKRKAW